MMMTTEEAIEILKENKEMQKRHIKQIQIGTKQKNDELLMMLCEERIELDDICIEALEKRKQSKDLIGLGMALLEELINKNHGETADKIIKQAIRDYYGKILDKHMDDFILDGKCFWEEDEDD